MVKINNFNICFLLLNIFILFTILFTIIQCKRQLSEGQACTHRRSRSPGTCKVRDNCKQAEKDIRGRNIRHQFCGSKNNIKMVCCRNTKHVKTEVTTEVKIDTTHGISRGLCLHYAQSVYVLKHPPFNVPGAVSKNVSQCDMKYRPLIYGGAKAGGKEFPHMALIGTSHNGNIHWYCGGSLITEEWILTAAHCVYTAFGDAEFVRLGELDHAVDSDDAAPQDFKVAHIKKHPDYGLSHYNDIALLKLNKRAILTAYVRPACLWTEREIKSNKAIITGWGDTKFLRHRSSHLVQATVNLISHSECNRIKYNKKVLDKGILDDMQFCAGALKNESVKDACQGDSGGPLQIHTETEIPCMYYIIGVTSFGKPCGLRFPGVYTRVSNYIPWIERTIWKKV